MERNLLISRPDNRTYVDENGNFRPAFHIIERDSYTPIEDGYQDTVFVREMDEAVIDADEAQAQQSGRRIDEGLAHSFV